MMGISGIELMVIALVTLILFGPKELPEVLRTLGGYVRSFRRLSSNVQRQFNDALREAEREVDLEKSSTGGRAKFDVMEGAPTAEEVSVVRRESRTHTARAKPKSREPPATTATGQ